MDAVFHNHKSVSRDDLKRLGQKNNTAALRRFVVQYGLLIGTALAIASGALPWWLHAPAVIACGLLITSCFAPLHECSHLTAFAARRMNHLVGWLGGLPLLFPPAAYREFHFEHHRHTHDPQRDPEIAAGGEKFAMWPVYAHEYLALGSGLLLLGLRVVMLVVLAVGPTEWLWRKMMPFMRDHARGGAVRQTRAYVAIYAALGAVAYFLAPGVAWLLVSLWIGHSALALYLASEHTGLPTEGSIFDRTRTTLSNRLVRYFMWNMPYHAEHHAYPSVPFHALPELHRLAEDELVHTSPGYVRLHGGVMSRLRLFGRPGKNNAAAGDQAAG